MLVGGGFPTPPDAIWLCATHRQSTCLDWFWKALQKLYSAKIMPPVTVVYPLSYNQKKKKKKTVLKLFLKVPTC